MSSRGRTSASRCNCKDLGTGKPLGPGCPELSKRRHAPTGWTSATWITTSKGRQELTRSGFTRESDASAALDQVGELVKLAGPDPRTRQAVGDFIWEQTKQGGQLPSADEVRRRFALGHDLGGPEETLARHGARGWPASARHGPAGYGT